MASRFLLAAARRCSLPLRAAAPAPARPLARGSLAARAMAGGAQINSELIDRMTGKIRDALAAERVEVADVQGDGRHVEIVVVASAFEGKSAVNRQRMVYKVRRGAAGVSALSHSAAEPVCACGSERRPSAGVGPLGAHRAAGAGLNRAHLLTTHACTPPHRAGDLGGAAGDGPRGRRDGHEDARRGGRLGAAAACSLAL